MQKLMLNLRCAVISAVIMAAFDFIFLFALSFAVYSGKLSYAHCDVLLMVSLILSSMFGAYISNQSRDKGAALYLGGGLFVLGCVSVLSTQGAVLQLKSVAKITVAVFVGVFLGNFLKNFIRPKLHRKKKARIK